MGRRKRERALLLSTLDRIAEGLEKANTLAEVGLHLEKRKVEAAVRQVELSAKSLDRATEAANIQPVQMARELMSALGLNGSGAGESGD